MVSWDLKSPIFFPSTLFRYSLIYILWSTFLVLPFYIKFETKLEKRQRFFYVSSFILFFFCSRSTFSFHLTSASYFSSISFFFLFFFSLKNCSWKFSTSLLLFMFCYSAQTLQFYKILYLVLSVFQAFKGIELKNHVM